MCFFALCLLFELRVAAGSPGSPPAHEVRRHAGQALVLAVRDGAAEGRERALLARLALLQGVHRRELKEVLGLEGLVEGVAGIVRAQDADGLAASPR